MLALKKTFFACFFSIQFVEWTLVLSNLLFEYCFGLVVYCNYSLCVSVHKCFKPF